MSRVPAPDRSGRVRPLRTLTEAPPPPVIPRIVLAALASAAGAIVVPATMIGFYAAITPSSPQVTAFALRTAEPAALVAAVLVALVGARWAAAGATRPWLAGAAVGVLAALLTVGAALWTGDLDGWTGATAALQPLAGLLGGRWAAARAAAQRRAAPPPSTTTTTGEIARAVTPAVAFEATLVPPVSSRTGETRAARRDEPVE